MQARPHPEQGFRACLGILRFGKRYSLERLEATCQRASKFRALTHQSVESILKTGKDRVPLDAEDQATLTEVRPWI